MVNYRQIATCDTGPCYIECGGTLIDKEYVITAAHCIRTTNPSDITLIAGAYNQSSTAETDTRQVRTVQEIHVHPDYNSTIFINDITVLRVDTSFTYTTYVQPACLPGAKPQPGDEVVIIGWGSEIFGGNTVDNLKQGYTTVVGNCDTYWAQVNNARQICVANSVTGNSACQGDSGGPILSSDNGQYVVSGVASYVHDCNTLGASNSPNVYTRVSAYETWIHSIIGQK
jgi:secreted trypsin-like serine protease